MPILPHAAIHYCVGDCFTDSEDLTFPTSIKKDEINEFHLFHYTGNIHVVSDETSLLKALEALKDESVLGFDTETRPAFERGVSYDPALVQLASADAAYLFQLKAIGGLGSLLPILSNPDQLKVGVAIAEDVAGLRRMEPFDSQGFFELTKMSDELSIENKSLRALVAIFFRRRISKSVQVSNWANERLTPKQINYAATDAWVCRELYLRMKAILSAR